MITGSRTALRPLRQASGGSRRLVCFPHAGGSARYFSAWADHLPLDVEAFAVQYPGREDRLSDGHMGDLKREAELVAAEVLALPSRPLSLFGHSLGASFAHEVTLALARVSAPVEHLVVSARPPTDGQTASDLGDLPDEQLRDAVRSLTDGPSPLDDDHVWLSVRPVIRADIRCLEKYHRPLVPVLTVPITAVGGVLDHDVDQSALARWSAATRGAFQLRLFDGGHFYLDNAIDDVLAIVLATDGSAD